MNFTTKYGTMTALVFFEYNFYYFVLIRNTLHYFSSEDDVAIENDAFVALPTNRNLCHDIDRRVG